MLYKLMMLLIAISVIFNQTLRADEAPECKDTWESSSAKMSCGANYCTYKNMMDDFTWQWWYALYPDQVFQSSYDANKKECTFKTLCVVDVDTKDGIGMWYVAGPNDYDRAGVLKTLSVRDHGVVMKEMPLACALDLSLPAERCNRPSLTCYYTSKTVKVGTHLKNQKGYLEIDQ